MTGIGSGRRHTRDDVADAALRILDEYGLPDLTMRRLASALEVQPSALYWHFPNKQTLLAELADRIVARMGRSAAPGPPAAPDRSAAPTAAPHVPEFGAATSAGPASFAPLSSASGPSASALSAPGSPALLPAAPASWSARVRAEAAALRDALLAYRDGAEVVASTLALGLGSTAARDRLAAAVAAGGFDGATALRAAVALLHFVLGHVSHEQQRMQYDSIGVLAAEPGRSPLAEDDPAAEFAFGVDLLVGGLELSRSRR